MDVRLLYHTPDPERAVAVAARLCYAPVGAAELMEHMDDDAVRKVLRTIMDERALLGARARQLHVRDRRRVARDDAPARAASARELQPAVAALRLLRRGARTFVVPPAVAADPAPRERVPDAPTAPRSIAYRELIDAGVRAEDARYLLPNAIETKIVVTMNMRELLHFFELRCCKRAQWEIRELALRMLDLAEPTAPYIFMDAGASCRRGPCREGKMTCGEPVPARHRNGRPQ